MSYTTTKPTVHVRSNDVEITTGSYNGSSVVSRSSYTTSLGLTDTRSGSRVDNWREKIRLGENASSPYSRSGSFLVNENPGTAEFFGISSVSSDPAKPFPATKKEVFRGIVRSPEIPGHLSVSASKARAAALSSIYSKISSEAQRMNSLATLAEFGDVIRQFGAPAAAIVDLSNRRLNRLNLERRGLKGSTSFKRIKWLEIVASTYLEYAFGLAPLIDDTRAVAESVARWQNEATEEILRKLRTRLVSRGTDSNSSSTTSNVFNGPLPSDYLRFRETKKVSTEARAQYVVGMKTSVETAYGSNTRLLKLLGITPENLIPAAWEAIPWSWLADYFSNIQQILQAGATSTSRVNWIVLTEIIRTQLDCTCSVSDDRAKGLLFEGWKSASISGSGGSYSSVSSSMVRTLPTSLGVPPLVLELPVQVGQLANMVAVLFSRRPSSSALWVF